MIHVWGKESVFIPFRKSGSSLTHEIIIHLTFWFDIPAKFSRWKLVKKISTRSDSGHRIATLCAEDIVAWITQSILCKEV